MIINPYDKAKLEKQFPNASFKAIENDYETGKTYFSGYWHEYFTVIDIKRNMPVWETVYVIKWENGKVSSHATKSDHKHDFQIIY